VSSEIEIKGLKPSGILWLHQVTGDALAHSVSEQELENLFHKYRDRLGKIKIAALKQDLPSVS